jgi:hypothetical protein
MGLSLLVRVFLFDCDPAWVALDLDWLMRISCFSLFLFVLFRWLFIFCVPPPFFGRLFLYWYFLRYWLLSSLPSHPHSPSWFHLVWFPSFPSALQMRTRPSILSTFSPPPTTQLLRGCSRKSAMSPLVLSEVHLKAWAASTRVMKNASFKHWGCCRLSRHRQRHRPSRE